MTDNQKNKTDNSSEIVKRSLTESQNFHNNSQSEKPDFAKLIADLRNNKPKQEK